ARAVWSNLVRAGKADVVWRSKPGSIGEVESLPAKLDVVVLLDVEVFEHREIEVALPRSAHLVVAGAAEMAEVRARWNLTSDSLKRLRIIPLLTTRVVDVGIRNHIRPNRTIRQTEVASALRYREWKSGSYRQNAVNLPST